MPSGEPHSGRIHPITLSFRGAARIAEPGFRRDCLCGPAVLPNVRWAILTALTCYLAFSALDAIRSPDLAAQLWWIRLGVGAPACGLAYAFTFHPAFERFGQLALAGMIVMGGLGVDAMIAITPTPVRDDYYAGLILVSIFGYALLRLRFIWASAAGLIIFGSYQITAGILVDSPAVVLINNNFFLICINLFGMIIAFSMEFAWRRGYLLEHDLRAAQQHLARVNQQLELRVTERTEQLQEKNRSLEREMAERRQIQSALLEHKDRLDAIIGAAQAGIVTIHTATGVIVQANPMAEQLIGAPPKGLLGRHHEQIFASATSTQRHLDPIPEGVSVTGELIALNGDRIPIQWAAVPVELDGEPHRIVSFSDIRPIRAAEARRLELQQHLEQSNRLNALGTLAGGVAHDLNNLLYGMIGFTELALDNTPTDAPSYENLQEILDGGRRARATVEQMLAFSRQTALERDPVDLVGVIQRATEVMAATAPKSVSLTVTLPPQTTVVYADIGQIHHVMIHLMANAMESIPPTGGQIDVRLDRSDLDDAFVAPYPDATPGPYAHIHVSDTGRGIPAEILSRVFDPFFTTKAMGGRQGMGLAATHGIVQSHGGIVIIDSTPGQGTRVDVYLPLIEIEQPVPVEDIGEAPGGTERILMVDDQLPVLKMTSRLIADLGYTVDQRTSSIEALGLVAAAPDRFDLVITDHLMPNMNGMELARQIHAHRPSLPVIVCTGFSDRISEAGIQTADLAAILNKPLLKSHVAQTIRRVLDALPPSSSQAKE